MGGHIKVGTQVTNLETKLVNIYTDIITADVFGDFSATRQFDMLVYAGLKIREEDQQEAAFTDGTNDSFVNARAFLRKDAYHPLCLYFKRYYKDKIGKHAFNWINTVKIS